MNIERNWTAKDIPDLQGKVVVITGANDGIGFESAREFARKGALVVFACRNQSKAMAAIKDILDEIPHAELEFIQLDLSSLRSIHLFAEKFKERHSQLDILLNNAGIMRVPYGFTEDGFEKTVGTNHLGHFALTGLLMERIMVTPGARVVTVSSNAHYAGELDLDDLAYQNKNGFTPMKAYSRSKLTNLMFTHELQRRFEEQGVDALALAAHPGISATGLADHFLNHWFVWVIRGAMKLMFQSSAMGALPSLRAAVDPQASGGSYFGPDGEGERSGYPVMVKSSEAAKDFEATNKLWEISQELTGVYYLN
jgi:NAD(P)-dependent dehydrogenase (short-subunit alcohol dehydrogenase family)